jgi:hypothetical protein
MYFPRVRAILRWGDLSDRESGGAAAAAEPDT